MMKTKLAQRVLPFLLSTALISCGGALPGMGGGNVDPNACGAIDTSDVGRKVKTFLEATAKLDTAAKGMADGVKQACLDMGTELGMAAPSGDTAAVCNAVVAELSANMKVAIKADAKLNIVAKPAECTVNAEVAASAKAACEGSASGDAAASTGGDAKASGAAAGSCEASANVNASLEAQCTPPEVTVDADASVVVDAAKLEKVKAAITKGLPKILELQAKAKLLAEATVKFAETAKALVAAASDLASAFAGKAALCVSGQLAAAGKAVGGIQANVSVSVSVSASVSGAASGSAQ